MNYSNNSNRTKRPMTIKKGSYSPGKVDYNRSGRKNCRAAFTWELKETTKGLEFSAQAEIWNPRETDIYMGGQCLDTVAAYFPNDSKVQRIVAIWKKWHLNGMKAGTPAQHAELDKHTFPGYPASHYDWASGILAEAGLNPDNGYSYGSAWLHVELPAEVVAEIKSW